MERLAATAAVALSLVFATSAAAATDYAPVDTPGPPLGVPAAKLDSSLTCTGGLASSGKTPVLLVPGTTVNPDADFSWNWEPALTSLGIPWCAVTLPGNSMDDIQVAGEYVVNAIRTMHAAAGRKLAIVGHSQGGMVPRWALRFWPDTRAMVDDVIGLAPSNHGTVDANLICALGCAPALWQQAADSEFIKALNSQQETFAGISYTAVFTRLDEVVFPNLDASSGSSALHGGDGEITNVAVQDVCPLDVNEHLLIGTIDPAAYALAMDAITHPGPADPSRVSAAVCSQLLMPGVNPATFATDLASAAAVLATTLLTYPHIPAEPPLACYVTASCPAPPAQPQSSPSGTTPHKPARRSRAKAKKCKKKRRAARKKCAKRHRAATR